MMVRDSGNSPHGAELEEARGRRRRRNAGDARGVYWYCIINKSNG
jgi:hypothetical protein